MSKVKLKLNKSGVRQMLRSEEMQAACVKIANDAVSDLGDGFSVNTKVGKNRVNAEITADSYAARWRNNRDNLILKALGKCNDG